MAVQGVASTGLKVLGDAIVDAMGTAAMSMSTMWTDLPSTGAVTLGAGGGPAGTVAFIQNSLAWLTALLAVLAMLAGCIAVMWEQRAEPARAMGKAFLTLLLVNGLGLPVIVTALALGDAYSTWVLSRSASAGPNFGTNLMALIGVAAGPGGGAVLTPILLIICIGLGLIASLIQIVLMVFRQAMLLLLAGVLPTAAASTNTRLGRQWFDKVSGWTLAFIAYKATAVTIYATAFVELNGTGPDQLVHTMRGVAMMVLAVAALPALMRWFVPVMHQLGTGLGGGGMAGVVLAALPIGAQVLQLPRASSGSSGPSGATLPGGAAGGAARFGGTGTAGAAGAAVGAATAATSAARSASTTIIGGAQ